MTIDEAILKHRTLRKSSENHNDKHGVFYSSEEHEQLAEWLEELEMLRELKYKHKIIGYIEGFNKGYSKAIDDFAEKLKQENKETIPTHSGFYRMSFDEVIDEIAEQLKEFKRSVNQNEIKIQ